MVCIKKQPYIYFVRLTFKNRHFFRYLTCLLDRGHIIAGGLFVSHLRSETDLKSPNEKILLSRIRCHNYLHQSTLKLLQTHFKLKATIYKIIPQTAIRLRVSVTHSSNCISYNPADRVYCQQPHLRALCRVIR